MMQTSPEPETNMNANELLAEIRKLVDTTKVASDVFAELCQAATFYARGGFSLTQAAKLAVEECI